MDIAHNWSRKYTKHLIIATIILSLILFAFRYMLTSSSELTKQHYDIIAFVVIPWKITPQLSILLQKMNKQWETNSSKIGQSTRLIIFTSDETAPKILKNAIVLKNIHHFKPIRLFNQEKQLDHVCKIEQNDLETYLMLKGIKFLVKRYSFNFLANIRENTYFRVDYYMKHVAKKKDMFFHGFFEGPTPCLNIAEANQFKYTNAVGFVVSYDVAEHVSLLESDMAYLESYPNIMFSLWLVPLELDITHDSRFHDTHAMNQIPLQTDIPKCHYNDIIMHSMKEEWWNDIDEKGVLPCDKDHHPGTLCHSENCITDNDPTEFSMCQFNKDKRYKDINYNDDLVQYN